MAQLWIVRLLAIALYDTKPRTYREGDYCGSGRILEGCHSVGYQAESIRDQEAHGDAQADDCQLD